MISALKAEFRKLFSVRSTYVIALLMVGLTGFICYQTTHMDINSAQVHGGHLASRIDLLAMNAIPLGGIFGAVTVALLMLHEFRYNTINYSLTMMRRSKFLAAKIIASLVMMLIMFALTAVAIFAGAELAAIGHSVNLFAGVALAHVLWTSVFYVLGFGLVGVLIALIVRSPVATFAILFLMPGTIEPLLGLVLKSKASYLPFTVLENVLTDKNLDNRMIFTSSKAALLFGIYMLVGWAIGGYLFMKRDAN